MTATTERRRGPADQDWPQTEEHAATELELWIDNTESLWRRKLATIDRIKARLEIHPDTDELTGGYFWSLVNDAAEEISAALGWPARRAFPLRFRAYAVNLFRQEELEAVRRGDYGPLDQRPTRGR